MLLIDVSFLNHCSYSFLSLSLSFLRFIYFQFMCMSLCLHCLCTTCVHCLQRPEEGDRSLEGESQGVVRHHVGAGKHNPQQEQ